MPADLSKQTMHLIQEELCRVIAEAERFQTCIEAHRALLTVRRIATEISDEQHGATRAHPDAG